MGIVSYSMCVPTSNTATQFSAPNARALSSGVLPSLVAMRESAPASSSNSTAFVL
jgi:hypothetical protein